MKIDKSLYAKLIDYTSTDYEPYERNGEDYLMLDSERVQAIIDDLLIELSYRDETIEDLQREVNSHCISEDFDPYQEYGLHKDNFS